MPIGRPHQDQSAGENSTNYQAGQDIHLHGLTIDQARTVALDVFKSNAIELAGIAQSIAVARAEQLTNDFLSKLGQGSPERAAKLADPDVQNVLFEAQKEFARSGEEDLKIALVDLLAARSDENDRNLRTLALNEAIVSAPKLTERQRRAIAWIFYLRYTRDTGCFSADVYYSRLNRVATALGVDLPTGLADYQHIEYVGAGTISLGRLSFGKAILNGVEGLYTRGFTEAEVDTDLFEKLKAKSFVIPSMRDASRYQLQILAQEDLQKAVEALGLSQDLGTITRLMSSGRMGDGEVADEATAKVPVIAPLREAWDSEQAGLGSMTLTSVGIAIGHAYWSRLTGFAAPLKIWLP